MVVASLVIVHFDGKGSAHITRKMVIRQQTIRLALPNIDLVYRAQRFVIGERKSIGSGKLGDMIDRGEHDNKGHHPTVAAQRRSGLTCRRMIGILGR